MNSRILSSVYRSQKATRGFTLIELLVAVSIFAAVITVIYTTLYTGLKAYHRTQAQLHLNRDVNQITERLSVELRNSLKPYGIMFDEGGEGQFADEHSLSFFTIHDAYSEEGVKTVVARMSYVFVGGTLFKKRQVDGDAFLDEGEFDEEILLTDIESFHFSYLSAELGEESTTFNWQSVWSCTSEMPRGIRMQFVRRDLTTDTQVSIDRYIVISQGALNCAEEEL